MNIFKIPESLESKYRGSGYALAATLNGQLVDIVYLRDIDDDFDEMDGDEVTGIISDQRLAPTVRQLQALGDVHMGMCSCWEFIEL